MEFKVTTKFLVPALTAFPILASAFSCQPRSLYENLSNRITNNNNSCFENNTAYFCVDFAHFNSGYNSTQKAFNEVQKQLQEANNTIIKIEFNQELKLSLFLTKEYSKKAAEVKKMTNEEIREWIINSYMDFSLEREKKQKSNFVYKISSFVLPDQSGDFLGALSAGTCRFEEDKEKEQIINCIKKLIPNSQFIGNNWSNVPNQVNDFRMQIFGFPLNPDEYTKPPFGLTKQGEKVSLFINKAAEGQIQK